MTLVRRVARPLLATMFVAGGLDALRHPGTRGAQAEPLVHTLAPPLGLPEEPELWVRANGAAMVAGGALLATGHFPRLAATVLAGTLVPSTALDHAFWAQSDPERKRQDLLHFVKNLSVLGGVLLAAVDTQGKPGLAYRARMAGAAAARTRTSVTKDARYAARIARAQARLKQATAADALS